MRISLLAHGAYFLCVCFGVCAFGVMVAHRDVLADQAFMRRQKPLALVTYNDSQDKLIYGPHGEDK